MKSACRIRICWLRRLTRVLRRRLRDNRELGVRLNGEAWPVIPQRLQARKQGSNLAANSRPLHACFDHLSQSTPLHRPSAKPTRHAYAVMWMMLSIQVSIISLPLITPSPELELHLVQTTTFYNHEYRRQHPHYELHPHRRARGHTSPRRDGAGA